MLCIFCICAVLREYSLMSLHFFHDLTDREPSKYSITVKNGDNPVGLKADGIKVYTITKELHDLGVIMMRTSFGHSVPVYDAERTVCDNIRSRNGIEMQTSGTRLSSMQPARTRICGG